LALAVALASNHFRSILRENETYERTIRTAC
jgi:hypothetical protein